MKKINAYQSLTQQAKKKVNYYLTHGKGNKALFLFDHGLGDYVEFLTLFNTVQKKYKSWDLKVGFHPSLEFDGLHPDGIPIDKISSQFVMPIGMSIVQNQEVLKRYDLLKLMNEYDYIFGIQYYDYLHPSAAPMKIPNAKSKNEMCKVLEFGIDENEPLIPYHIKVPTKTKTNKVAFHFNGHTDKNNKTPSYEVQKQIWEEIVEAGFDPIDVHQNRNVSIQSSKQELPDFIPEDKSIRNESGGLPLLLDTLSECQFCVGILSGPLHLSNNILGSNRCIGTEVNFPISKYVGDGSLDVVDTKNYEPGKIKSILEGKSKLL